MERKAFLKGLNLMPGGAPLTVIVAGSGPGSTPDWNLGAGIALRFQR